MQRCVIIGAGPAGLTAAYELHQSGISPCVLEQDRIVGGIAKTVEYEGYRFDIGGHRFFTKVPLIDEWWNKILDDDFLLCSRLSRIYYKGKFFDYPLKPLNARCRPRASGSGADSIQLRFGSNFSASRREDLRAVGEQSIWPPPL